MSRFDPIRSSLVVGLAVLASLAPCAEIPSRWAKAEVGVAPVGGARQKPATIFVPEGYAVVAFRLRFDVRDADAYPRRAYFRRGGRDYGIPPYAPTLPLPPTGTTPPVTIGDGSGLDDQPYKVWIEDQPVFAHLEPGYWDFVCDGQPGDSAYLQFRMIPRGLVPIAQGDGWLATIPAEDWETSETTVEGVPTQEFIGFTSDHGFYGTLVVTELPREVPTQDLRFQLLGMSLDEYLNPLGATTITETRSWSSGGEFALDRDCRLETEVGPLYLHVRGWVIGERMFTLVAIDMDSRRSSKVKSWLDGLVHLAALPEGPAPSATPTSDLEP